jgi:DNA-binding NarL/FixJ family response regulator
MAHDVVRLVREGLGNKDIGARLFISPRTVQTQLSHVLRQVRDRLAFATRSVSEPACVTRSGKSLANAT